MTFTSQGESSPCRVSLPLCQHTSPGPPQTSSLSPACCSPPETLLCSPGPMKSRCLCTYEVRRLHPVKDTKLLSCSGPKPPYHSPKYSGLPGGICLPSQLQKVQADPRPDQRLQTETLTNAGQKHKYVNTGGSHPAGISLLTLWSKMGAECTCIQGQRLSEQTAAFP